MRLQCMMRVQFGDVIHEVGEVIERDYEEVKQAIRDRALIPLPDLPPAESVKPVVYANVDYKPSTSSSDTSEVKED